jgi:DNA-binding response OmpR family regulator
MDAMDPFEGKPEEKLKGKNVLVVEDYPLMGALLLNLLKRYGHVSHAKSGKEAIKEIRQTRPDIVLLDLGLPDMSGLEVARQLRNDPETTSIPILAMSGSRIQKKKYLEAGCNDFILKPFEISQLLDQLAELLRR